MNCIACDGESDFSYLIVTPEGSLVNGFCQNCETQLFGKTLRQRCSDPTGPQCLFCRESGYYILITPAPSDDSDRRDIINGTSFQETADQSRLCKGHFKALIDRTKPEPIPKQ